MYSALTLLTFIHKADQFISLTSNMPPGCKNITGEYSDFLKEIQNLLLFGVGKGKVHGSRMWLQAIRWDNCSGRLIYTK